MNRGSGKDTDLPGAGDCFGPVGDIELAIDTGRVGFDGAPGHDELLSDLLVGPAQGDELENLQLPLASSSSLHSLSNLRSPEPSRHSGSLGWPAFSCAVNVAGQEIWRARMA
jgi:hypothetical protein